MAQDQDQKPSASLTPSASTVSSGLGSALAVIVISVLHQGFNMQISPELAISIGAVCATVAGYIPRSGRV